MSTAARTLLALAALAYVAALGWSLRTVHAERSVGADATISAAAQHSPERWAVPCERLVRVPAAGWTRLGCVPARGPHLSSSSAPYRASAQALGAWSADAADGAHTGPTRVRVRYLAGGAW